MFDALKSTGFTNITPFYNGKDAWNFIQSLKGGDLKRTLGAIISDIEMPQMDGHTLLRLVRGDKELAEVPFVMFSSLIHDNMRQKGESAGADAQFSRAQLADCIKKVVDLMG